MSLFMETVNITTIGNVLALHDGTQTRLVPFFSKEDFKKADFLWKSAFSCPVNQFEG